MPTYDLIRKLAVCWPEDRLRERAKLWPEPLTWEWFLGDRCDQYSHAECCEILATPIAYVQSARVQLPDGIELRKIWIARKNGDKPQLLAAMIALGAYLDAWDAVGAAALEDDSAIELERAAKALIAIPRNA